MPGSGDHRKIDRIKDEVRSALKLLFRQVETHKSDLALPARMTHFITAIPGEAVSVPLEKPAIAVSADPIRVLKDYAHRPPRRLSLLETARLAETLPCAFDPVPCHEPMLEEVAIASAGVSFENLAWTECKPWPLESIGACDAGIVVESDFPTQDNSVLLALSGTRARKLDEALKAPWVRENTSLYALPVRKAPIPPHRFPPDLREQFRKALAEKAGTRTANIQLRVVYERMDMALYSSFQQDEQGNLLCIPKNDFLGRNLQHRNARAKAKPQVLSAAYLVFGFRLDNKEDIRALVPANRETLGGQPQ